MPTLTSLWIMPANSLLDSFPWNQGLHTLQKLLPPSFSLPIIVLQLGKGFFATTYPSFEMLGKYGIILALIQRLPRYRGGCKSRQLHHQPSIPPLLTCNIRDSCQSFKVGQSVLKPSCQRFDSAAGYQSLGYCVAKTRESCSFHGGCVFLKGK